MVAFAALASALTLAITIPFAKATDRGLAWATDNRFAQTIGSLPQITWYHHWEDGPVSEMPSKLEYVPMFWGPSMWGNWNSRVSEMNQHKPGHLMGFNEPDVSSQSNMDPYYAAELFYEQIQPWGWKGVKLGSPALVWNLDWLETFLQQLWKKGGNVDFICLHWYGSWNDLAGFQKYVSTARQRFGYKIWITELGVTSDSNPTDQQTKEFMMNAYAWMDQQGYILRASWFGCFISYQPPDSYATGKNALFKAPWTLSDMGYWYGYSTKPNKRELSESSLRARHIAIAERRSTANVTIDSSKPTIHCDHICELRKQSLDTWHAANPNHPPASNDD